ncbi:hypothetical protein BCR33DRAFT_287708 [Rhizoclosmatium globosum]|uniref:Uncharacterized protein n=1 Tax=Rhizoclosmatium globosum TaxID=329046 RepID=A0A1Y2C788_9FUNG|nr:hypothetical protein BCR33DRAFT_287708 [Rhizoclosmatium globosum]|eukprot:ORY42898.1 hypothetical protein BCR33DRAFT_287708 [Rhizoclosmatium globosum]
MVGWLVGWLVGWRDRVAYPAGHLQTRPFSRFSSATTRKQCLIGNGLSASLDWKVSNIIIDTGMCCHAYFRSTRTLALIRRPHINSTKDCASIHSRIWFQANFWRRD